MKNKLLPLLLVIGSYSAYSQVGIGKVNPNRSAQLEVFASDKGILIPRVKLTGSTDATSIVNGNVESLMVFNTADVADIKSGYYYWFDNKWNRILISGEASGAAGSVIYNSDTKQFTYIDAAGNTQIVNIADVIKGNETVTTLVNKGEGLYTYKNEEGTEVDINVVGDVIGNASTIFNNAEVTNFIKEISEQTAGNVTYNSETKQFSYVDVAGNTQVVNIADVIKGSETVTTLENKGEGLYTYKNEEGTEVNIDVVGDVIANASTIINNSDFKTGITEIIKTDETLTTLDSKGEGVYVYTNEKGDAVTIDVVGDVVANASTIFNNPEVTNFIKEISEQTAGNVTYNSETKQFSYVDVAGNTQVVNIADVIKGSETVTTLENKGEGLYTYKNEEGTEANIDVVGDVIANASTIINNPTFKTELTEVIKTDETLTTLEDKGQGLHTYTNENGVTADINVVSDVTSNASTIFNNADVITELTKIVDSKETLTTLEDKGQGLHTYTNENGVTADINVVSDVTSNASTIFNNASVVNELTKIIDSKETVTTLTYDTAAKTLVYKGEAEEPTTINLADITTTTPDTVLAVSGTGATFTAATVNIVPSTVVGDVLTTTATGVVAWKAPSVMAIEVIKADYTVLPGDYTIIAEGMTGDIKINLPDPTLCKGRMLVINQFDMVKADGQTALMVNFNYELHYSSANKYSYLAASLFQGATAGSMKVTLQSDGRFWYVITYTM